MVDFHQMTYVPLPPKEIVSSLCLRLNYKYESPQRVIQTVQTNNSPQKKSIYPQYQISVMRVCYQHC